MSRSCGSIHICDNWVMNRLSVDLLNNIWSYTCDNIMNRIMSHIGNNIGDNIWRNTWYNIWNNWYRSVSSNSWRMDSWNIDSFAQVPARRSDVHIAWITICILQYSTTYCSINASGASTSTRARRLIIAQIPPWGVQVQVLSPLDWVLMSVYSTGQPQVIHTIRIDNTRSLYLTIISSVPISQTKARSFNCLASRLIEQAYFCNQNLIFAFLTEKSNPKMWNFPAKTYLSIDRLNCCLDLYWPNWHSAPDSYSLLCYCWGLFIWRFYLWSFLTQN